MKVLVGCEESQEVTKAFRALGHEAYSCDLIECSGGHPEWHIQDDIFNVVKRQYWDLIIIHPPCTALCSSGNRTYASKKPKYWDRLKALKWTLELWDEVKKQSKYAALENPMGILTSNLGNPQYIQPYEFGDPEIKKTGLWLYNLPPLKPTNIVEPESILYKSKKTKSGFSRYGKITGRSASSNNDKNRMLRSKTYPGIAKAMADQWSALLDNN